MGGAGWRGGGGEKAQLAVVGAAPVAGSHETRPPPAHPPTRRAQVWIQTIAPGQETPIHSHPPPCEEINYVIKGAGVARTLAADGSLLEAPLVVNSTAIAPPGLVWQVGGRACGLRGWAAWVRGWVHGSTTPPPLGLPRCTHAAPPPPTHSAQVANTGEEEDLQVVVVIGCRQPGINFFPAWNATLAQATVLPVMAWNQQCPPGLAAALKRLV